ncbi:hormogonium polysaccharide secretion pseudopilin HpsB [Lyngbya aestuarii]|uniref:hormogonium polysaccharide secretion pseudopilin HpsB n=1 Tax=Lyngbya aestuarii TaxID=118322 RepID=UPI00403E1658
MMLIKKQKPNFSQNSQSGFTIIESLVAILVVTILMVALSPVIVLSVATRLQARRVERATEAAKAYVDGVRSGAIEPPNHIVTVNAADLNTKNRFLTNSVAAPTALLAPCDANTYCPTNITPSLYCIDLDGGGCTSGSPKDLIVQAFRSVPLPAVTIPDVTDPNIGYLLGVRVYRADGFDGTPTLVTQAGAGGRQSTNTGGLGNRQAPLMEITTDISSRETSYGDFCDRLGCGP